MFNHILVGSNDIHRPQSFYDAVLACSGSVNLGSAWKTENILR